MMMMMMATVPTTTTTMTTTRRGSRIAHRDACGGEYRCSRLYRRRRRRPSRTTTTTTTTRAFIVPTVVPNPNADDGASSSSAANTLPNIERAVSSHGWRIGSERGYDESPHVFKIYKVRDGHAVLEALQDRLYASEERGCRIRRESQTLYYMCCDGVRCRLNEGKKEVVVEIPCDLESVQAYVQKVKEIEETVKKAGKK